MLAGRMLASSFSERSYSCSIAASARRISRSAYQTVATAISDADATETTKPTRMLQSGCTPVSSGMFSSNTMARTTPSAARAPASTMRSMPSTSTRIEAATRK